MKLNKILFFCIAVALLLTSCYGDKGNYDYSEIPKLSIEIYKVNNDGSVGTTPIKENDRLYAYLAQEFKLKTKIKFENEKLAHDDIEYTWTLDNKVLSKDKDLNVIISLTPQMMSYFGNLSVLDKKTGLTYLHSIRVDVASNFSIGWMWLTKNGSNNDINMFTNQYQIYTELYSKINNEQLPNKAIGIVEHFQPASLNYPIGIPAIVCGERGGVELDHSSLKFRSYIESEFMGGQLPNNISIAAVSYIDNYSVAVTTEGSLYVRYAKNGYFHQGRYNNVPYYGDYKLSNVMAAAKHPNPAVILMYDLKKKCYKYFADGIMGDLAEITDAGSAFKVGNVLGKPYYMNAVDNVDGKGSLFFSVINDNGQFIVHELEVGRGYLNTKKNYVFPYQQYINETSIVDAVWKSPTVYIATNDKLYMYNRSTQDEPVLLHDFKGKKILSMSSGIALNAWTSYKTKVGVTVKTGDNQYDFHVVSASGSSIGKLENTKSDLNGIPYAMSFKAYQSAYFNY